jgi:hypothetical protein
VLKCAIELSRDAEFRKKRSALFDWQEDAIKKGWSTEEAVQRIAAMSDDYNEQVKRAAGTVQWKLAFPVCGIGLGFASGVTAIAAGTAALSGIQFLAFDRKPAVDAGSTGAAAMFHDVKTKLGIRLER